MESILTKKVVYVIKALYYLEVVKGNEMTSVVEIAESLDVPKRFLEQLFLKMRREGVLVSVRGAAGGYKLARTLDEISYREVLEVLEEGGRGRALHGNGLFGENAFVVGLQKKVEESTSLIMLGDLVDEKMRRKALAGKAGGYVYHI